MDAARTRAKPDCRLFSCFWGHSLIHTSQNNLIAQTSQQDASRCKARFKRRTLHVPNLMQMSENNSFFSFVLDSAHVKFDVWNGPNFSMSFTRKTPKKPKSPSFAEKPKSARIPTAEPESQALVKNRRGLGTIVLVSQQRTRSYGWHHSRQHQFSKEGRKIVHNRKWKTRTIRCQGDVMHWKRRSKLTNSAKILMGYLPFCQLSVIGHIDLSDIPLLGWRRVWNFKKSVQTVQTVFSRLAFFLTRPYHPCLAFFFSRPTPYRPSARRSDPSRKKNGCQQTITFGTPIHFP